MNESSHEEKSSRLFAFILVGIALLAIVVGGIWYALYKQFQASKDGQRVLSAADRAWSVMQSAGQGPGTKELEAAGCNGAAVLDVGQFANIFSDFTDAGLSEHVKTGAGGAIVVCSGSLISSLPDCDEVARIYAAAAHPTASFTVMVSREGVSKAVCEGRYSADGTSLGTP